MANPEIKLVFNAETGKASQNIQDLYNKILSLAKNRGSDFTSEEVRKINEMIEAYDKYERKVKGINEYVRSVNSTEFGSENQVEKTLDRTEKKLQRIIYDGTQIASLMRSIGIEPRELESYVNLANTLSLANKEFDIAIRNKERLLNQPTAPRGALVTSYPWEKDGTPNDPNTPEQQFRNKYAKYAEDIGNYQRVLNVTIDSTERLKAALRDKYAALKETDDGYLQQKQLLESLLGTIDKQILAQSKVSESVKTQIADWEKLYKTTTDSKHWLTGLQEMEKRASGVEQMYQKIQITAENAVGIQNKYNNAQIKNNEKSIKSEQRYQAALETTGLTYQELTQLYSQLLTARAQAQTPEQIQAIDRQLTAVRKNITLMGRETQLSGAKMIGAQTSVMGVMHQVVNQWRNGTLTLRGLTLGIKLFAKSTVVLAAIQLAWEGISWALEKAKAAFFGTAEAEKEAADRAKEYADAIKDAHSELLKSQHDLYNLSADQARLEAAKQFSEALKAQNEEYSKQVKLINESIAARMYEEVQTAKTEDRDIALNKLELQQKKLKGTISEEKYQEKLLELEMKAAKRRREAELKTKNIALDGATEKVKLAEEALEKAKAEAKISDEGYTLEPERIKTMISNYKLLKAEVDKDDSRYGQLASEQENLTKKLELLKKTMSFFKYTGNFLGYKSAQATYDSLHAKWDTNEKELGEMRQRKLDMKKMYSELPKIVRKYGVDGEGLEQYTKEFNKIREENKALEGRVKDLTKEVEKAKEEQTKALNAVLEKKHDVDEANMFDEESAKISKENIKIKKKQKKAEEAFNKKMEAEQKKIHTLSLEALRAEESEIANSLRRAKSGSVRERQLKQRIGLYSREIQRREALQNAATMEGQYEGNTKDALALASGGAYAMLSDGKLTGSEIEKLLKTLRAKNNIQNENLHRLLQEIIAIAISNKMITQKTYDKYKNDLKSAKLNFIDK